MLPLRLSMEREASHSDKYARSASSGTRDLRDAPLPSFALSRNACRWFPACLNHTPQSLHKRNPRLPCKEAFCLADVSHRIQNFVGADFTPRDNRLLQTGGSQHQVREFARVYRTARAGVEGIEAFWLHGLQQKG